MWRHLSKPRNDWKKTVESLGLVYPVTELDDGSTVPYWNESAWYEMSLDEVETLEAATEELYRLCLGAVDHMLADADRFTDEFLFLPAGSMDLARKSWNRKDASMYSRFDLVLDPNGVPKMLEINGDTPTGLVESAVIQWDWLESVFPDSDQWNSIHDRLVNRWSSLFPAQSRIHFVHTEQEKSGEEEMTTVYMRDTADAAGMRTYGHSIEGIGWDKDKSKFVDFGDKDIDTCFKLYPWEDMLREEFGSHIIAGREKNPVQWIEPAWKLLLSTKALLAVLWELNPGHENLLPAYFDGPRELPQWVAKPFQGREGANVRIHLWEDEDDLVQDGGYGDQPVVYQEYVQLPSFDGNYVVIGSWIVGESSAGCLIRESDGPVTDYFSRVVPHAIPMEIRPDEATIQEWLKS